MPIYQYKCPKHGIFEKIKLINFDKTCDCPECGQDCSIVVSAPAIVKVPNQEKLPVWSKERIEDRRRLMKDTKVTKALSRYKEEMHDTVKTANAGGDI